MEHEGWAVQKLLEIGTKVQKSSNADDPDLNTGMHNNIWSLWVACCVTKFHEDICTHIHTQYQQLSLVPVDVKHENIRRIL